LSSFNLFKQMASGDAAYDADSSKSDESGDAEADDEGDNLLHVLAVTDAATLAAKLEKEKWRRRLNDANNEGKTPLHLAVMAEMAETVAILVESGASLLALDEDGNTALHLCCLKPFEAGFRAIADARRRLLLGSTKSGTQKDAKNDAKNDNDEQLKAALHEMNFEGHSCGILATLSGSMEILRQMRHLSIDLNVGDMKTGRAPLHHAVEINDFGLIEFLVGECGVNINAKTFSEETALSLANEDNREHLCILLTTLGAKEDPC